MTQRDFVDCGRNYPDPKWPGNARIAVNFVLNYEEGSEYSLLDGDAATETAQFDAANQVPPGMRDLTVESVYKYGTASDTGA